MVLVKDAGYELRDIRGEEYTETITRDPTSWEQHLAAITPGVAWKVATPATALAILAFYWSGSVGGVAASVVFGVAMHYLSQFDPEPTEETVEVSKPGMSVEEVMGRLVQHDEHEQMKEEEAEAEARKAKRKGGSP